MLIVVAVVFCCTLCANAAHEDEIVVKTLGGPTAAKNLAEELGYIYQGPVRGFEDIYLLIPTQFEYPTHPKRGLSAAKKLKGDSRVEWAEHQHIKVRSKRDYQKRDPDAPVIRVKRLKFMNEVINDDSSVKTDRTFNDDLWPEQWYMHDTRTNYGLPKLDLNVLPVYKTGITGRGIRVSMIDDGLEYTHDDLKTNYDPSISWNCNEDNHDSMPRYDQQDSNSHGTRCAGEVSMTANNRKCGVGIAYNANIGGIKMLDGLVNDRVEGTALGFAHDRIDIYSASWGPSDDGKTLDGPGRLATQAIANGISKGRRGNGAIFVWASGNGGGLSDNCNCDGYLTTPYTITIGSASQGGCVPFYGEPCASTMAVTYSSGAYKDQMVATADLHNECTTRHSGTSASAPLAAGIIALGLEANYNLTWRDVQHLIVWTSEISPVVDNTGWFKNAVGLFFNTRFGFGLMNAFAFVTAAVNWTSVPPPSMCAAEPYSLTNNTLSFGNPLTVKFKSSGCRRTKQEVRYLEHVELNIGIDYTVRGALEAHLISPSGTKVQILNRRRLDKSNEGFQDWTFMSVATWGESPKGIWTLIVADNVGPHGNIGQVANLRLNFRGTKARPRHMKNGPRRYNQDYNKVHNRFAQNNKDFPDAIDEMLDALNLLEENNSY